MSCRIHSYRYFDSTVVDVEQESQIYWSDTDDGDDNMQAESQYGQSRLHKRWTHKIDCAEDEYDASTSAPVSDTDTWKNVNGHTYTRKTQGFVDFREERSCRHPCRLRLGYNVACVLRGNTEE